MISTLPRAFVADIIKLLQSESEWVCCQGVFPTPMDLIAAYGIFDDGEDQYEILKAGESGHDISANEVIIRVLRERDTWGEFIGGVLASFLSWDDQTIGAILPQLQLTVAHAWENGVDH